MRTVYIECECGSEVLQVGYAKEEDGFETYYLAMYEFGGRRRFWSRVKYAWKILKRGKPYNDQMCLTPEEANKLASFIREQEANRCDANTPNQGTEAGKQKQKQ